MTTEEKQLLLKDICARLPYGVYVKFEQYNEPLCLSVKDALAIYNGGEIINDLQYLYLRPMSSMTDEEYFNYKQLDLLNYQNDGFEMPNFHSIDWLNAHYFDYRGLIEKGLALPASKEMYKTK